MSRVTREEKKVEEPTRTERVPVAANRSPLVYKGLDTKNFQQRWVIDRDDRIALFLQAGYTFVKPRGLPVGHPSYDTQKQDGARVTQSAGYGGLKLYLMEIPMKFYKEDQAAKQRDVDEIENSMRTPGKGKAVGADVDYGKIDLKRDGMQAQVIETD
jgi:hypothetical protein